MTTTNKLDLRTCPLPQLCEWVAVNIMGWTRPVTPDSSWETSRGVFAMHPAEAFRSLDAVAAVEAKAREGRLKPEARLRAVALAWDATKEGR